MTSLISKLADGGLVARAGDTKPWSNAAASTFPSLSRHVTKPLDPTFKVSRPFADIDGGVRLAYDEAGETRLASVAGGRRPNGTSTLKVARQASLAGSWCLLEFFLGWPEFTNVTHWRLMFEARAEQEFTVSTGLCLIRTNGNSEILHQRAHRLNGDWCRFGAFGEFLPSDWADVRMAEVPRFVVMLPSQTPWTVEVGRIVYQPY